MKTQGVYSKMQKKGRNVKCKIFKPNINTVLFIPEYILK